jgi:hypothetical protein
LVSQVQRGSGVRIDGGLLVGYKGRGARGSFYAENTYDLRIRRVISGTERFWGQTVAFRLLSYLPDRRSTRIEQSIHIIVRGLDVSRARYKERLSTLSVSCHGCRYLSRNEVLRGDSATIEVLRSDATGAQLPVEARVLSVKALGTGERLFDVVLELVTPQDIWGVPRPPTDWSEFAQAPGPVAAQRELHVVPRSNARVAVAPAAIDLVAKGLIATAPQAPGLMTTALMNGASSPTTRSTPPFLVHLAASLREQAGCDAAGREESAADASTQEYVQGLCSRVENDAAKELESLVASFAVEINRRVEQLGDDREGAARRTYERLLRKFELELANRRLA